ncbi:uncharacterized protein LOC124660376 [Lolium rigidum]|uniref:uncharacterized protein LOC124660376 n=1 Tax=Lolium rigidum TaxID=89674 RepID=UPI001F5CE6A9|nr:uncharacterized protein LOC124660376 [Lolium rigidum]
MDGADGHRSQRQASCSCAPSMSRRYVRDGFDLDDDDDYYFDGQFDKPASSSYGRAPSAASSRGCGTKLRGLWRKIVREKKRILLCTTGCVPSAAPREPYDAYSYAQNFDDGAAWVEPENLSRSFSARFAVPSRVLQRVAV